MVSKTNRAVKTVLMLLALFALGGVTGVFATLAFTQDREASSLRAGPPGTEARRIKGLARRLDLDDEQRTQVKALLRKNRDEKREIRRKVEAECGHPLQTHREAFETEMKKILRPEQLARYEELQTERRKRGASDDDD